MTNPLNARYDHKEIEPKRWDFWEKGSWFHADENSVKEPYSIIMPPPNVTARLHMGHGLNNTLQDILIRWKRMQGYNAMWLPGTDHAGIATQMMVEKSLEAEGLTRKDLGREEFFKRCVAWQEENGGVITSQLRRLGCSCDWEREVYTMDETLSKAVRSIFVKLFNDGYIYRGERLVNWDPKLGTALSDDEVENIETKGFIWHFKYPVEGSESEFVEIATTRPETMFGDTAVAVHPEDERYQHLKGKHVLLPFTGRKIPIVFDDYVKPEFGSGCVKITPAHDPNDFALGKRHNLPLINVMNEDASMNNEVPEEFRGLDRFEARKLVLKKLKEEDLFVEQKKYAHTQPISERSKVLIEPRLSKQWFVKMTELVKPALECVRSGELSFYPENLKKTYFHWLENIQDWCISRQLWWGHRIPIWYCDDCNKVSTGEEDPSQCSHCGSDKLTQDEDVLDTWFSSWLWPVSPFGWPEDTKALEKFFPSEVLITGSEIIFLWVARMVILSHYTKGKTPFKDVYFNSVICDKQGRKFSKTLGNGIDPLEVIEKHGADAVRYTCLSLAPMGGRVKMDPSDFDHGSRFITKIWNAARFLHSHLETLEGDLADFDESKLDLPSKWLLGELHDTTKAMNDALSHYRMNEAVELLYNFIWKAFCDWSLETTKDELTNPSSPEKKAELLSLLVYVFDNMMRLASPLLPFVTEELWQSLPHHPRLDRPESLVIASFPDEKKLLSFEKESKQWSFIQKIVSGLRSLRSQAGVPPKEKVEAFVKTESENHKLLETSKAWITRLANLSALHVAEEVERPDKSLMGAGPAFTVYVPVSQYLDFDKEKKRLESEKKRIEGIVKGLRAKVANKNFMDRAPEAVVKQTKDQLENMESQLKEVAENLLSL